MTKYVNISYKIHQFIDSITKITFNIFTIPLTKGFYVKKNKYNW